MEQLNPNVLSESKIFETKRFGHTLTQSRFRAIYSFS